jgi:hypothetical protein
VAAVGEPGAAVGFAAVEAPAVVVGVADACAGEAVTARVEPAAAAPFAPE